MILWFKHILACCVIQEPPSYSSVAHIRPPSAVEVNEGTTTQPVAVTTDANRVQYTTDMGIDNVSVSLVWKLTITADNAWRNLNSTI